MWIVKLQIWDFADNGTSINMIILDFFQSEYLCNYNEWILNYIMSYSRESDPM